MCDAIIGIDPGAKGALCLLSVKNGLMIDKAKLPESVKELSFLLDLWTKDRSVIAVLEQAHAGPVEGRRQGTKSMFQYGRGFGRLEAALELSMIQYELVHPRTWTARMHKETDGENSKAKSLRLALTLAPADSFLFPRSKKPHDGLIDAFLIAHWAKKRFEELNATKGRAIK